MRFAPDGSVVQSIPVPVNHAECVPGFPEVNTRQVNPCGVALSPSGDQAVYGSGDGPRRVMLATGTATVLTTYGGDSPEWSPIGDRLVYTRPTTTWPDQVVVKGADGTAATVIAQTGSCGPDCTYSPGAADWAPDGSAVYVSGTDSISGGPCGGNVCMDWRVGVFDAMTGALVKVFYSWPDPSGEDLPLGSPSPQDVAVTPDDARVVLRSYDGDLLAIDVTPGSPSQAVPTRRATPVPSCAPDIGPAPAVPPPDRTPPVLRRAGRRVCQCRLADAGAGRRASQAGSPGRARHRLLTTSGACRHAERTRK